MGIIKQTTSKMCINNNRNVLIVKTESQEIRIPYEQLSLSFETINSENESTSDVSEPISKETNEKINSAESEFERKLEELKNQGFTNEIVVRRVLTNQKGDMERTTKRLQVIKENMEKKQKMMELRRQQKSMKPAERFADKLKELNDKGHTNVKLNIRFLKRNNGDVEKTLSQLEKVLHVKGNKETSPIRKRK